MDRKQPWRQRHRPLRVGGDQPEYEIEPVVVIIKRSVRERVLDWALAVIASVVAITVVQVVILQWILG